MICVETEKENPVAPYFCDPHKRLEIEVPSTILHRMIKLHPHNQILLSRYELATRTLVLLVGTSQTSGLPQKIFSPNHTALRSECGKSCGGGTQTRSVQCIQEVGPVILTTLTAIVFIIHHLDAQVAHGGNNIISLGKNSCPQPPPRAQQFCNVIDCPVQWQASSWTKVIVVNTNKHTGTLTRASLPPIYRHQEKQDLVVMSTLRRCSRCILSVFLVV